MDLSSVDHLSFLFTTITPVFLMFSFTLTLTYINHKSLTQTFVISDLFEGVLVSLDTLTQHILQSYNAE